MKKIQVSSHTINVLNTPDAPGINFAYLKGEHPTDYWNSLIDHNMCKINFFIEGQSYIIVNDKSYVVKPGDIMLYHPHDVHYGNIPYNQYIEYYQFEFEPTALACLSGGEELIDLFAKRMKHNIVQLHPNAVQFKALKDSFEKLLLCCLDNKSNHKNIRALMIIIKILLDINSCKEFNVQPAEYGVYPKVLIEALRFINNHYQENITTTQISNAVFVSRAYLNRLFQKHLNCSIYKYILSLRMSKACIRLCDGMSVTDAAMSAGFQDSSSFATAFKRFTGISPSEFRLQYL